MAIQNRRGIYENFNPSKMLPGEIAVVLSGDPESTSGRSVYVCFQAGVVKRFTTYEDFETELQNATEEVQAAFTAEIQSAINNAIIATNAANAAVSTANAAAEAANEAAEAAGAYIMGDISDKTVTFSATDTRENIASGEKTTSLFGKIQKWFADLKEAAFCTVSNTLTVTSAGGVLDARQGNELANRIGDMTSLGTSEKGSLVEAVNELNTNKQDTIAKGTYTGNIDELIGKSHVGAYWVHSTDATGTFPETTYTYFALEVVNYTGSVTTQRLVSAANSKAIFYRLYTNAQWYDWYEYNPLPTSLKNPYALTINANGNALGTYDGSTAKSLNITYDNVGAPPKSHASSASTYGLGSTANYGHVKTINNLTTSSYTAGNALNAYQGYLLKQSIDEKNSLVSRGTGHTIQFDWTTISGKTYLVIYVDNTQVAKIAQSVTLNTSN